MNNNTININLTNINTTYNNPSINISNNNINSVNNNTTDPSSINKIVTATLSTQRKNGQDSNNNTNGNLDIEPIVKMEIESENHHPITREQIIEAIKILRGNGRALYNCPFLAHDLIKYFKTGIPPTSVSKSRPATLKDFQLKYQDDDFVVKSEDGLQTKKIFRETKYISIQIFNDGPSSIIPISERTLISIDPKENEREEINFIDVDNQNHIPLRYDYRDIAQRLKDKAAASGIIFGYVVLAFAAALNDAENPKYKVHVIAFYATPDRFHLIDGQKIIRSIINPDDPPLFSELSSAYEFANQMNSSFSSSETHFGTQCFAVITNIVRPTRQGRVEPSLPISHPFPNNEQGIQPDNHLRSKSNIPNNPQPNTTAVNHPHRLPINHERTLNTYMNRIGNASLYKPHKNSSATW